MKKTALTLTFAAILLLLAWILAQMNKPRIYEYRKNAIEFYPLYQARPDGGVSEMEIAVTVSSIRYDGSLGETGCEQAIRATWPSVLVDSALSVSFCESSWNPAASNGTHFGCFQIGSYEWATYGDGDVFDPWANSVGALRLYEKRGWQPWVCKP